jgi:hypothetical protein
MSLHPLVFKAASMIATGAVGAAAYDGARTALRKAQWRSAAVRATELAIRGTRRMELGAEQARLAAADIVAEARERVGEEAPPPAGPSTGHGHNH